MMKGGDEAANGEAREIVAFEIRDCPLGGYRGEAVYVFAFIQLTFVLSSEVRDETHCLFWNTF